MTAKHSSDDQIMTNREILRDIHLKVNRMHTIVIGDEEAKQKGLVHKVESLEKAAENRKAIYIIISAVSAGVAVGIKAISDFINK